MMEFKKSPVVFDEESHSYRLADKKLLGITGLIHSVLGLGVYPDADDYTKDRVIPRAGSRGTAVHHAIQTFDQLGIEETEQIVCTKYGCVERGNVEYVDERWDVSAELDAYIRNLQFGGFVALANELTVSDNDKYASQIDNVWLNRKTGGIWLVDTKTNNIRLYPICGYFNPAYFKDGESALKEYLSWQLSIYAVLFELENPGLKVEGLACNWLRKDTSDFWTIERKPDDLVRELLKTEYIFTDSGPVYFHHDPSIFGIGKNLPAPIDSPPPILPEKIISHMANLMAVEAEAKAKLDEMKNTLRKAMEQHGIKSWDSGMFKATISADSQRSEFNTALFKKDHPDLYGKYVINKTVKGSFTIKAKKND